MWVLAAITAVAASAGEMVVIVNKSNAAANLSPKQVKNHFMRIVADWSNGEKVRPVDQPGGTPIRSAFLDKLIGMSPAEFERYWIEKQYSNAENPPMKAPDDATVIKLVATLKGGIGFVSQESLAAADNASVKPVLSVPQ